MLYNTEIAYGFNLTEKNESALLLKVMSFPIFTPLSLGTV